MKLRVYTVKFKDGEKATIEAHNVSTYANMTQFYLTTEATQVMVAGFPTERIESFISSTKV